jgi:hypothetical protein
MAAVVFLTILAVYVLTIAPTTQFWDTSEYIAAAKVVGIPHPPGSPLFVLLANVWGMIPIVGHYALRINLFAAVTSALASGLLFLVADRFLRNIIAEPRWARLAAAAAGVLVGATSFTVWNQSVVNAKVYTVSLLSIALVLWLAVHWGDEPPGERRDHWLILIIYVTALSATNHLMGLLAGPAVLVYVLYTDPRAILRWRVWVAGLLVVAVGVSVWLVLPIRAGFYPAINEGEPTTWEALLAVLRRDQYQKGPLIPRQADLYWQYANYLQYFVWQFAHDLDTPLRKAFAFLFGGLGLIGAVWQWQRDRRGSVAMISLMFTVIVLLVFYLDFKYGFSIRSGENLLREVRERDYFFIASFQLWGVWVAVGLGTVLHAFATVFRDRFGERQAWQVAAPVLAIALVPLWANSQTASRAGETLPRDFAWDLLQSVEPYGIVIATGDNDTFPLWYMQEVEGVRQDVLIANTSLMNTLWHARQLKRRSVFPFDTATAIEPYRDQEWTAPTTEALSISYEEIDALPPIFRIQERSVFQAGGVSITLEPQVLRRTDLVTLQLIQDNIGKRPVYFSRTTGNYADRLGLTPYLLGQGIVRKLMPEPIEDSDNIKWMGTLSWVDQARTEALLFDHYHVEAAARPRPQGWVDEPSEGILSLYALLYATYAQFLAEEQTDSTALDPLDAERLRYGSDIAQRIFEQTSFFARLQP